MSELLNAYWPMILVAVAIGLITGLIVFRRPKQRVTLSKAETPVRPHMAVTEERPAPSPVPDEAPERVVAPVSDLGGSGGDDLQQLKGVGPKLASLLKARGLTRYEQLAALSQDEVSALDADLGTFKGRLTRDRIVEQAAYLARGDQAGYEAAFGKL